MVITKKQRIAAKKNIKKALKKWKSMSSRTRALAQPQGRARKKPGTGGGGKFYRIVVRPKSEFTSFKIHDVGKRGHIERLAGRRKSGSWSTQAWLIAKTDIRVSENTLVGKTAHAKSVLSKLSRKPRKVSGNVFEAGFRKNIPERSKPTKAMRKAQKRNIKKAQKAHQKKRRK
tara:strand:+ start:21961 stop:22479 length:519 start_codon:yes stop_codon:yes gene_type:complete